MRREPKEQSALNTLLTVLPGTENKPPFCCTAKVIDRGSYLVPLPPIQKAGVFEILGS